MIYRTANGTPYLCEPQVVVVSRPQPLLDNILPFLESYGLGYEQYLDDPTLLGSAEEICKFSGQLDYLSFGENRTYNLNAQRYLDRIKAEKHGNVLEHASFGVLCWGISRSCTHEIVRHRLMSYSQVSQRYVGPGAIRFVQRPELRATPKLQHDFEALIDDAYTMYVNTCTQLADIYKGNLKGTDLLKHVRQAARDILPNCTEAPILITANVRAWRYFLEQRASLHAETSIRALAVAIYTQLVAMAPMLFNDYDLRTTDDGTQYLYTEWSKV